jgi:hypothetical protein
MPGLLLPDPVATPQPRPVPNAAPLAPAPAVATRAPEPAPAAEAVPDGPWYRQERWLAVTLAALVPLFAALLVPQSMRVPLVALGVAFVLAGVLMLTRHERALRQAPPTRG